MITLSDRLKLIFNQLHPNQDVWDLCCDHGYLGLYAYQIKQFNQVHFVDQVPEIIQRLEAQFKAKYSNSDNPTQVHFLATSAIDLNIPLTGNVVISGVGSYTIYKILEALQTKGLLKAQRLILCPQNDVFQIEDIKKLPDFSYRQLDKNLSILEKDRLRKIYVFDQMTTDT